MSSSIDEETDEGVNAAKGNKGGEGAKTDTEKKGSECDKAVEPEPGKKVTNLKVMDVHK